MSELFGEHSSSVSQLQLGQKHHTLGPVNVSYRTEIEAKYMKLCLDMCML